MKISSMMMKSLNSGNKSKKSLMKNKVNINGREKIKRDK